MVHCPVCDDAGVARVPSAKVRARRHAWRRTRGRGESRRRRDAGRGGPGSDRRLPAEMVAKLREIVRNTENVGRRFPEEARKIHYDEAPARAIRGQASKEESAALAEEGIDVATLPDFLLRDRH